MMKFNPAVSYGVGGRLGQRFHLDEPLFRKYRLDDRFASLADRKRDLVIVDLLEQSEFLETLDDLRPSNKTI